MLEESVLELQAVLWNELGIDQVDYYICLVCYLGSLQCVMAVDVSNRNVGPVRYQVIYSFETALGSGEGDCGPSSVILSIRVPANLLEILHGLRIVVCSCIH